jgi:cyclic pyranopterin phosphate synthase
MLIQPLTDNFSRSFRYLRLSLTEKCNFKCNYCLPDGSECHSMSNDLTLTEIRRLVTAFALLGTEKIRLTGGEPTLRRDINDVISCCKSIPGIKSVALTTNGFRLEQDVSAWRQAGLDAINVSLDSLRPEMFQLITGSGKLNSILNGLEIARNLGFKHVKINTVLLREQNAEELNSFLDFIKTRSITLRFIELMRTGDNADFFSRQHLSAEYIREYLLANGWTKKIRGADAGPAKEYSHPDYRGSIGLIMPYSQDFCASCNRLRVSSQAELYLCLFAEQHLSFRELLQSDDPEPLIIFLQTSIQQKTAGHNLRQQQTGSTRQLAMIGG